MKTKSFISTTIAFAIVVLLWSLHMTIKNSRHEQEMSELRMSYEERISELYEVDELKYVRDHIGNNDKISIRCVGYKQEIFVYDNVLATIFSENGNEATVIYKTGSNDKNKGILNY